MHDTTEHTAPAAPERDAAGSSRDVGSSAPVGMLDRRHHHARARIGPGAVVRLQRAAGNAAVAGYVQRSGCGCAACGCTDEAADERTSPEEGPAADGPVVQRDLLDVAGAVLPDWVTDLVTGIPAAARSAAGLVGGDTAKLESGVAGATGRAGGQLQGEAQSRKAGAEATARTDAGAAESEAGSTDAAAAQEAGRSEGAALNLPSAGTLAGPLLNPANPTLDMDQLMATADRIGALVKAIPGGAEQLAGEVKQAVQSGTAADGQPGWNCDQAEVMSMAGGIRKAIANAGVRAGKAVLGEDRYNSLAKFVNDQIKAVQDTVAGIRKSIQGVVDRIGKAWDNWWKPKQAKIDAFVKKMSEKWEKLTGEIKTFVDNALKTASQIWADIEKDYITPFVTWVGGLKKSIDDKIDGAIKRLGSWWSKLPNGLKNALLGAAAVIAGPIGLALAAATKAVQYLISKKDAIFKAIRETADGVMSFIGEWYQKARKALEGVIEKARKYARDLVDKARKAAAKAAALVDQHTPQWVKNLRAAAENLRKKIAGEACTALGETAGPCAEQFVPDLGPNAKEGASHDVTVQATGEMSAVVYGVPVKVAGGASVALSRVGKLYTVVVAGDGAVAVTTPQKGGGDSGAKVEVELPGALGDAQKAWKAITGKSGAPPAAPGGTPAGGAATPGAAAPAPTAAPSTAPPGGQAAPGAKPAAAPGGAAAPATGGTTQDVSAEAGYKGKVEMTYVFDGAKPGADNTCDGVGGMTAMLAGLGVGALMPAPFNSLGGSVQGDYSNHLTACSITLSQYGNAKVDVKNEGVGGIEAAITAETGVTVGRAREVNKDGTLSDEWVDTATIFGSLGGSLGGELLLRAEPPIKIGGKATASGKISATLSYNEKKGVITAMSVSGTASFGMAMSLPQIKDILPEAVALVVEKALEPYLELAAGTVEATATLSFNNLQTLLAALDTYVNSNGPAATSQGVIDVVAGHFSKEGNLTAKLSVVLKVSKTHAKVAVSGGGDGYSGKAEVSVVENKTIPLYP